MMDFLKNTRLILALSMLIYLLSLMFPVFYTELVFSRFEGLVEDGATWYGYQILLLGWGAILTKLGNHEYWSLAWLANPCYFLACYRLHRLTANSAFPFAFAGAVLAFTSVFLKRIWNDKEPPEVIISSYGAGYWLWLSAFALLVLATWVRKATDEI